MIMRLRRRSLLAFVLISVCVTASNVDGQPAKIRPQDAGTDDAGKPLPGATISCAPIAEKRQDLGCYVVVRQRLGALPRGTPLSWQLDGFPTRVAAEAAKGQLGAVIEAFERTWLFTIAPPDWRPGGSAEHVATVGPLPLGTPAAEYTAMYLATTFRPGLAASCTSIPGQRRGSS
jgi:hypothetical protein